MLIILLITLHAHHSTHHSTYLSFYSSFYILIILLVILHTHHSTHHFTCSSFYSSFYILITLLVILHTHHFTRHFTCLSFYSLIYLLHLLALSIFLSNALSNASIERIKHIKQCFKQCFLHNLKTVLLSLWLVIFALSWRSTLENSEDSEYLLLLTSFFLHKRVSTFYFIWNNANWLNRMHSS